MIQACPRALDFFDKEQKEIDAEKKKVKMQELESQYGVGHIPVEELALLEIAEPDPMANDRKNNLAHVSGESNGAAAEEDKEERVCNCYCHNSVWYGSINWSIGFL